MKIAKEIPLFILSTILTLCIIECAIRVFFPQDMFPKDTIKPSEYLIHENIPNRTWVYSPNNYNTIIHFNKYGFRDHDYPIIKPPQTYRICIIGDSFVEGFQVDIDSIFPKILEKELNSRFDESWEVLNCGVNGYGTDQAYILLSKNIKKFKPDFIIYFFCINDIDDIQSNALFTINANNQLQFISYESNTFLRIAKRILRSSHLVYLIRYRLAKLPKTGFYINKFNKALSLSYLQKNERLRHTLNNQNSVGVEMGLFLKDIPDAAKYYLKLFQLLLKNMKKTVQDWNGQLIVVIGTRDYQMRESALTRTLRNHGLTREEIEIDKPNRLIKEICAQEDIPSLDLLPILQIKDQEDTPIHFSDNAHWSHYGHQMVARALFTYIR